MKLARILILSSLIFLVACGALENVKYNSESLSNAKVAVLIRWVNWRFDAPPAGRDFIVDLNGVVSTHRPDMLKFTANAVSKILTKANVNGIGAIPEDNVFVEVNKQLSEDFTHVIAFDIYVKYVYSFFAADKSYFHIVASLFPNKQSEKVMWRYTTEEIKLIAEDENEKTYSRTQMMIQGDPLFPKFYKAFVKYAVPIVVRNLRDGVVRQYGTSFSAGKLMKRMRI